MAKKAAPTELIARTIHIERKEVSVALKENAQGQYIEISETTRGRVNRVIIPRTGQAAFAQITSEVFAHPPAAPPPALAEVESPI